MITIEEISKKYGCNTNKLQNFIDYVLEYPGELSMAIRKIIVLMVSGACSEPVTETFTTDPGLVEELRSLELAAQYLQGIAADKEQQRYKREAAKSNKPAAMPHALCPTP